MRDRIFKIAVALCMSVFLGRVVANAEVLETIDGRSMTLIQAAQKERDIRFSAAALTLENKSFHPRTLDFSKALTNNISVVQFNLDFEDGFMGFFGKRTALTEYLILQTVENHSFIEALKSNPDLVITRIEAYSTAQVQVAFLNERILNGYGIPGYLIRGIKAISYLDPSGMEVYVHLDPEQKLLHEMKRLTEHTLLLD